MSYRILRKAFVAACLFASQPAAAATLSFTQEAVVTANAQVNADAFVVVGQEVARRPRTASDDSRKILQFPGFDSRLGRLDSVSWNVDYSGRAFTELLAACEKFKGLPFIGCRADATTTTEFSAVARAVEFSAPGAFSFVPLLSPRSLARAEVTSTTNNIVCGIRGGINGPCADIDEDTRRASNRVDRTVMRESYLRDFVAVTIDGELLSGITVACRGFALAAVCGASSDTGGEGTFRLTLEYGYTPADDPAPIPIGPTLPMAVAGLAALAGLRGMRRASA